MGGITGPGPWRSVQDAELAKIWYLEPQTTRLFYVFPITAFPPPGFDRPEVRPVLRRMLYTVTLQRPQLEEMAEDIRRTFAGREGIAVGARLLSSLVQVYQSPWAYPAVLATQDLKRFRQVMAGVEDGTDIPANITSATPWAIAIGFLKGVTARSAANATYMMAITNRYYSEYRQKIDNELALRGINPGLL